MEPRGTSTLRPKRPQPFLNFMDAVGALLFHMGDPIAILQRIAKESKDEHGNIPIGPDTPGFAFWRGKLEHLNFGQVFGPIIIATNPYAINAILQKLKVGTPAHFVGNRSTDIIKKLTGDDNVFSAATAEIHSARKINFKGFISNHSVNVNKVAPIVKTWVNAHTRPGIKIDDKAIASLSSQIMLRIFLDEKSACDPKLIDAVVKLKKHFVNFATYKELGLARYFNGYMAAKSRVTAAIEKLRQFPGEKNLFPNTFQSNQQAAENIISLMMVGFDNFQSGLMSLLIQLSKHPQHREHLRKEITLVDGCEFLQFDISNVALLGAQTFSQRFLMEALRLTPPVWLQARKNENAEQVIEYLNDKGQKKSFRLLSSSLVIIPNFTLMREIKNGNDFNPHRDLSHRFIDPFSTGPNMCPGKNIFYAAAGVCIADLITKDFALNLLSQPKLDPQVSLKWKKLQIQATPHSNSRPSFALETQNEQSIINRRICFGLGVSVAILQLINTHDIVDSVTAGAVVALVTLLILNVPAKSPLNKISGQNRLFKEALPSRILPNQQHEEKYNNKFSY